VDRESRNVALVVIAGLLTAASTRDVTLASIVLAVVVTAVVSFLLVRRWSYSE